MHVPFIMVSKIVMCWNIIIAVVVVVIIITKSTLNWLILCLSNFFPKHLAAFWSVNKLASNSLLSCVCSVTYNTEIES